MRSPPRGDSVSISLAEVLDPPRAGGGAPRGEGRGLTGTHDGVGMPLGEGKDREGGDGGVPRVRGPGPWGRRGR